MVMETPRRRFLQIVALGAFLPVVSRVAEAESYPARPVHIVVPFAPGITPDIMGRLIGHWLSERLGRQFIVENRAGSNGDIGTEQVVKATADGYTLLLATLGNATNATLYKDLTFNFVRDIAPVAGLARGPLVMEVHPSLPVKSVAEFIAYAKANPGKINFATGGEGSPQHVAAELFKMMAGVDMVHVPYSGNPLPDVLSGQVPTYFGPIPASVGYIRAGKLRALAVTGAGRSPVLPDVPAVAEFVPGYEASSWYGIGAPKDTPPALIEKLNTEINAAFGDPAIKARFADFGAEPMPMTPAAFGKFVADETDRWSKVLKFAGVKLD
jgi:tripartite-type tricarboxylate transporter receptor subunit TctC